MSVAPITYWLSMHVPYRCRHSGACCSSGWTIPVERDRVDAIQALVDRRPIALHGQSWVQPVAGMPVEMAGMLAHGPDGRCIFHRPGPSGGCLVHPHRPVSCVHFPHLCVIDPRGVHVTLSHYCPTAADLLFSWSGELAIVEGPQVLEGGALPEGLDARASLPPTRAERPGQLMSWHDVTAWERELVSRIAAERATPRAPDPAWFHEVRSAVPAPLSWPAAPAGLARTWDDLVRPSWPDVATVAGRYLAARAFASWAMHLGEGLSSVVRGIELARTVLQVEAVRQCGLAGRALDDELMKTAIRQSDLLLVHYADPGGLARQGRA